MIYRRYRSHLRRKFNTWIKTVQRLFRHAKKIVICFCKTYLYWIFSFVSDLVFFYSYDIPECGPKYWAAYVTCKCIFYSNWHEKRITYHRWIILKGTMFVNIGKLFITISNTKRYKCIFFLFWDSKILFPIYKTTYITYKESTFKLLFAFRIRLIFVYAI